jgi:hypothetical protein
VWRVFSNRSNSTKIIISVSWPSFDSRRAAGASSQMFRDYPRDDNTVLAQQQMVV